MSSDGRSSGMDTNTRSPSKSCLRNGTKRSLVEGAATELGLAEERGDDSIDSLLDDIRKEFNAGLKQTETNVIKVVEKHAGAVNKRIDGLEGENRQRKEDHKAIEKRMEAFQAELSDFRKTLAIAEAKPRSKSVGAVARDPDEFDPALVRINAANNVGFDAVQLAANALLARAGLKEDVATLKGPRLGRFFTLEFGGEVGTAARLARKVCDCLRTSSGAWDTFHVARPEGQGIEKMSVGLDRSPNAIKKSRNLRFLKEGIENAYPHLQPFKLQREGAIAVAWQTVVELFPQSNYDTPVWKPAADNHGIDTARVTKDFEERVEEFVAYRKTCV